MQKEVTVYLNFCYSSGDVCNAQQIALYYRSISTKTFALKHDKCAGRKSAKQQLNALRCTNMEGEKTSCNHWKRKIPSCPKGAHICKSLLERVSNKKRLDDYRYNRKSLHKFDIEMKKQYMKVLLFLNNAISTHSNLLLEKINTT